jgi:hypothetical protein
MGRILASSPIMCDPTWSTAQRFHAAHITIANFGSGVAQHSRPAVGNRISTSTPSAA